MIRTETLDELFDVAVAARQAAAARRAGGSAIVTNAGGPGIMCADACEAAGLEVPELPAEVQDGARARSCRRGVAGQPGRHDRDRRRRGIPQAIAGLAASEAVDAIIVIFIRRS